MRTQAFLSTTAILLAFGVLYTPHAHAYLDGGSAAMIFQMLIAGGLAVMVVFRSYWSQVKSFFTSRSTKSSSVDEKP